jgi:hypothetical protein
VSEAITHIAGLQVQAGHRMRQRCGWCGTMLADYDLANVAVPEGQEGPPAMWGPGLLVRVDGSLSYTLDIGEDPDLPDDACARLDDAVTA